MRGVACAASALAVVALFLTGCGTMGPTAMKGNRTAYNIGIQQSDKEELLLNLVRIRYLEPPFFMSVGSVSSSFNYQVTTGVSADINDGPVRSTVPYTISEKTGQITGYADSLSGYPLSVVKPNLEFQYYESPTITYTPLQGEKYVTQLLSEIDPGRLFFLFRAGADMDMLLDVLVRQLGTLRNPPPDQDTPEAKAARERFHALGEALTELQKRGDLQMQYTGAESGKSESLLVQMRFADAAEAGRLDDLFGIPMPRLTAPDGRVVAQARLMRAMNFLSEQTREADAVNLTLDLRNTMEVLEYLAEGVQAPEGDVTAGLTDAPSAHFVPLKRSGITVLSSGSRPSQAYVATYYEGKWFYIAQNDMASKSAFAFLMTLLAMEGGDVKASLPVLTIPVGGR
ncbi:hypothetical protein [Desulfolutivibrio sulfoxidireducens]|uniref:hypothetical protein n=1 Tax=Desulfolutivibrio sulfoxidireducens TaxID=2773299 RepID=UPI00159E9E6B|nr:hypothetical protein [Desulfolutivibrio sulfoxidireducens]QLA16982.1 hypothetical protein GD605_13225 [Desulfolutivibrio sulfoxidireducens]QLA20548.1 hypothetical protein GD604_12940 [Desulfolutivibrio sulfoxidireducens]